MPKFSIIIPVYNVAPYLRECLDSVLAQTFTDWEAICVDDGSTDGSGAILDEYAAKDKRFKVIHQKNQGVSAARNAALNVARGEWIGFVDADDMLGSNRLNAFAQGVGDNVDWVMAGLTLWQDDQPLPTISNKSHVCACYYGDVFEIGFQFISRRAASVINIFRHSSILRLKFTEGVRMREDALFLFEAASICNGLRVISDTGYFYRRRIGSAMESPRRSDDHIKLVCAFIEMAKRIGKDRFRNTAIVNATTYWIRKDIREWAMLCRNRTYMDELKSWRCDRKILGDGLLSYKYPNSTLFDKARWVIYLLTGFADILNFTRLSLRKSSTIG